ncbi:selenocysteine-specific translation elongation factor [Actinophytocola xinjiangensis]|uniref:Selenocysteine-specific elongation factor n=1 Tax=Actinophytocola xinjiangensis TaxID=485602 RepID=A0A7Z0WN89_9PSEU|nr:selenocysteine-specific translation elongation factor [Actinophytocola xinjiangensis]OLF10662.1 selenocysteine-specific translation elongation factor [Actinophytocola xinjiangensis]
MHVIATAGHVDHGKSTLVRALTGMEPDRLAEERRRGLTIDLGFAWTELDDQVLAFVDVPGHERFVPNMLAGAGPVPAAMFVVAADEGWAEQSAEHLTALDAFGVRHGLLVVTKSDRADPAAATDLAREQLAGTGLAGVRAVAVSGRTGAGLPELRRELLALTAALPVPDRAADVRLWVDRAFTIRGAGTVVTGTLGAGTLRVGDELDLGGRRVVVRGLQALGRPREEVAAVARVAVNLRGVDRDEVRRGDALLTPSAFPVTGEIDVRLRGDSAQRRSLVLHVGAAAVPCRVRPLGTDTARLALASGLALRAGDIGLLRDPGEHRILAAVEVLDPCPPPLSGRGAARQRVVDLADPAAAYLRRRGVVPLAQLRVLGHPPVGVAVGDLAVDETLLGELPGRVADRFRAWSAGHPIAAGLPIEALRREFGVPDPVLRQAIRETSLTVHNGLVRAGDAVAGLPAELAEAVAAVEARLDGAPFTAPEAADLSALGLGPRQLAAAERAGRLVRLAGSVVLAADAPDRAATVLAGIAAPFTVSDARRALGTTRRVAVPLLELLDARRVTRRHADGTRTLR